MVEEVVEEDSMAEITTGVVEETVEQIGHQNPQKR